MSEIASGNQVQLKSGGPVMTVEEVDGSTAHVAWFDGEHNFFQKKVRVESLIDVTDLKDEPAKAFEIDPTHATVSCPDCSAKLEIRVKFLEHRI